jgi:hypothetical protein
MDVPMLPGNDTDVPTLPDKSNSLDMSVFSCKAASG